MLSVTDIINDLRNIIKRMFCVYVSRYIDRFCLYWTIVLKRKLHYCCIVYYYMLSLLHKINAACGNISNFMTVHNSIHTFMKTHLLCVRAYMYSCVYNGIGIHV